MSKTINDIITSIAVIPDPVSRSVYIKTTAQIFEMDEQLLISEVQKKTKKQNPLHFSAKFPHNNCFKTTC